jgi:hypothetical protein
MKGKLSSEVKEFLEANIRSIEELEILFAIRSHRQHDWDAVEVARKFGFEPLVASNYLMALYLTGLLHHQPNKGRLSHYNYEPHPRGLEKRLDEVEEAFLKFPAAIIEYLQRNENQRFWQAQSS